MARYIDAEPMLREAIEERKFVFAIEDVRKNEIIVRTVYKDLAEFINTQPTAKVVEEKHGYLEHIADFGNGNCIGYCSECHADHKADNATALKFAYKYCRWCGTKLDKRKDEYNENQSI